MGIHGLARGPEGLIWRFWNKVKIASRDSCWLWLGSTNPDGYGRFNIKIGYYKYRLVQPHRFSWELFYGPIEDNTQVLHKCDIPACINPDHLFLGTISDNMKDMYNKGRHKVGIANACHPERPKHGKGLCRPCYMFNYRVQQMQIK